MPSSLEKIIAPNKVTKNILSLAVACLIPSLLVTNAFAQDAAQANKQPEQIMAEIESKLHNPEYMRNVSKNLGISSDQLTNGAPPTLNQAPANAMQSQYAPNAPQVATNTSAQAAATPVATAAPGAAPAAAPAAPAANAGAGADQGLFNNLANQASTGAASAQKHGSLLQMSEIKSYTAKCEGNHDLEACQKLGVHYSTLAIDFNTDIEINMRLAAFNLEKACVGGLKSACGIWGHALGMYGNYFIDDRSPKKDYVYGFRILNHSCELEDAFGCAKIGLLYYYGRGAEANTDLAMTYFNRACDLASQKPDHIKKIEPNLGLGCYYAGKVIAQQNNFDKDKPEPLPAQSVTYYEKGCELNSPDACLDLSAYYSSIQDSNKAIFYSQRTCLAGNSKACFENALQLHQLGNDALANRFLEIGCQMGNGDACTLFATNLLSGVAIEQDTSTAIMMLESSCKANNGLACMYLGELCYTGGSEIPNYSLPVNFEHAAIYFERSCSLGVAAACTALEKVKAQLTSPTSNPLPIPR